MSATNGGICETESKPNLPVSRRCARLRIDGRITVINGPEDLFIQWTYGRALVEGYQRAFGASAAKLVTYRGEGGAGHGVLIQHPRDATQHLNRRSATASGRLTPTSKTRNGRARRAPHGSGPR